jgi:DNA invertase Pin-like site-specific DNA recombinase
MILTRPDPHRNISRVEQPEICYTGGSMVAKLIAYYRVSTRKQGESGLGLEGQTAAVQAFAKGEGSSILRAYQEIETGKRADRPELLKALADCKRSRATLVIAKFDRLSRNVAFLANLLESGVDFVACDNPHANRMTVHILAAVAENEAKLISERTRAALAAYQVGMRVSKRTRERYPDGVPDDVVQATAGKLGASLPQCRQLSQEDSAKGREMATASIRARAVAAYSDLLPFVRRLRDEGNSLQYIADVLDAEGHVTRRGKPWNKVQVSRVLDRSGD